MQVGGLGGALNAGMTGIQKGQEQITQAAQNIASANTQRPVTPNQAATQGDLAQSLLEQKQGQRQVEASAKVVETAGKTIGSLIDIKV